MTWVQVEQWLLKMARIVTSALGIYRPITVAIVALRIVYAYQRQRSTAIGAPVVIVDHNFVQDIEMLKVAGSESGINLISFSYLPLYKLAEGYFPTEIRDGSYMVPEMELCKDRYRKVLARLMQWWKPEKRISCLITPSDSFFWIRELILLMKERGIPTIVVDKEGTISPHSMEHHSRQVRSFYPFISDYIIVWSERQKLFWQKTGAAIDTIFVAGQPRSDFFFKRKFWLPVDKLPFACGQALVLYFTFETDAYAPTPGNHIWSDLRNDIDAAMIALAEKHPNTIFVIKTHPQQQDRLAVENRFMAAGRYNIVVCHGAELSRHLIVRADVVVGFQTTALIEAMLAGKRVVYTEWSDAVYDNLHNLIPLHEAPGIDIACNRTDLEQLLDNVLTNKDFAVSAETMTVRKPFIDIFIPNADGNVSTRVMRQVYAIIKNHIKGKA